jgi:hypothetical protein
MLMLGIESTITNLDYYNYLLQISWPALGGLFLLYLFFLVRLYQVFRLYYKRKAHNKKIRLAGRIILTLIILLIYTNKFIISYGDWLNPPSQAKGTVASLELMPDPKAADQRYLLTLNSGEEMLTVSIDSKLYNLLQQDDLIIIKYLPARKEVYSCTVLNRLPMNSI